jgi:hypothetical protein
LGISNRKVKSNREPRTANLRFDGSMVRWFDGSQSKKERKNHGIPCFYLKSYKLPGYDKVKPELQAKTSSTADLRSDSTLRLNFFRYLPEPAITKAHTAFTDAHTAFTKAHTVFTKAHTASQRHNLSIQRQRLPVQRHILLLQRHNLSIQRQKLLVQRHILLLQRHILLI